MKRTSILLGTILLALVCSISMPTRASAQRINWRTDYAAARREAASKGLPIIIDFYMVPCVWCERLERDVFSLPKIAKTMNEEFVPLRINGEASPELRDALQIESYPTVVLAGPDGHILATMQGYQKPGRFYEYLQRALARVANPEWMIRDYQSANKALAAANPDYAKAVSLLKHILEDGKSRPIQKKASALLAQIEEEATQQFARARQLNQDGKTTDAINVLTKLVSTFPGTRSASEAGRLLSQLAKTPQRIEKTRVEVARELLGEAKEFYRKSKFSNCLDVCEQLIDQFGDLPEADHARGLQSSIQSNTEWMAKSCEELNEKLSRRMLLLAEAYLKKADRASAMATYQRVLMMFPNSRHARLAEVHMRRLRGEPNVPVEFQQKQ